MSEVSPRLSLPFLLAGQAQKEFFHNEALARIDMLLCAAVEGDALGLPPSAPEIGQSWIVAAGASGAWSGEGGALACWTSGGWRFVRPFEGLAVWNKARGVPLMWRGGGWSAGELVASKILIQGKQVIGERLPSIPSPAGGAIIDVEARAAIDAVRAALKSHGLTE
ncbi:MAG TPA: DUF2793 domain-containing protein [Allosphingosinicella sp.]